MNWCRLWHDMPNDPKWRTVAKISKQPITSVICVYLHLMVSASANAAERGRTQTNAEDLASALDLETDQVESILDAMQGRVLMDSLLSGWGKRQPKREDDSAERAKEWREEQKRKDLHNQERNRTQPNATERDVTQRNAPDKRREDTDTDNTPPTPSFDSSPSWILDETFTQFSELAKKFWPRVLPTEIADGHRWFWTKLSIEERLKATHNLRLRVDSGEDGEYVKHMPDYLKNEWRRGPKPSNGKTANGNGNSNGTGNPPKYEPPPGLVTSEVFEKLQRERDERARS